MAELLPGSVTRNVAPLPASLRTSTLPPLVWVSLFTTTRPRPMPRALVVNSGYRTPTYNAKIGGAAKSQHVEGRALDLMPLWKDRHTTAAVKRLWAAASERAAQPSSKIRGLGFYQWGVHMDTRPSVTLVTWDFRR